MYLPVSGYRPDGRAHQLTAPSSALRAAGCRNDLIVYIIIIMLVSISRSPLSRALSIWPLFCCSSRVREERDLIPSLRVTLLLDCTHVTSSAPTVVVVDLFKLATSLDGK